MAFRLETCRERERERGGYKFQPDMRVGARHDDRARTLNAHTLICTTFPMFAVDDDRGTTSYGENVLMGKKCCL